MADMDDLDLIQDPGEWRRRIVWEVRNLARAHEVEMAEIRRLADALPAKRPAWLPMVMTVMVTLLLAYISIVHNAAIRARDGIEDIQRTQNKSLYIVQKVDDLETRMRGLERGAEAMQTLGQDLHALHAKVDKLLNNAP